LGFLGGLSFYYPAAVPLLLAGLRLAYGNYGRFLLFGLGFWLGALLPVFKALLLLFGAFDFALMFFSAAAAALSLLQFGVAAALRRFLLPSWGLSAAAAELLRANLVPLPYFLLGHLWIYLPTFGFVYKEAPFWFLSASVWILAERTRGGLKTIKTIWVALFLGFTLLGFLQSDKNFTAGEVLYVIQPFEPQGVKLTRPELFIPYLEYLISLTPKGAPVFLPETVLPYGVSPKGFAKAFEDKTLVVGVQRLIYDFEGGRFFFLNEALLLKNGTIAGVYTKRFLLPFGEYTPKLFKPLGKLVPYLSEPDYKAGNKPVVWRVQSFTLSPLICNEIFFFPKAGGKVVAVLANDGWFYSPFIKYHRAVAQIYALKTQKVVLFVNNNGESALITPTGRVESCKNLRVCKLRF
jgi:apolipoprotein N-acyltransferase